MFSLYKTLGQWPAFPETLLREVLNIHCFIAFENNSYPCKNIAEKTQIELVKNKLNFIVMYFSPHGNLFLQLLDKTQEEFKKNDISTTN